MSKSRTGQAGGSAQQPRRQKSNVPSSSSSSRYGKSRQLNYDLDIDVNLIDDLFDQLDWYERALNLALPSYGQKRRGTQAVSQTRTRPTRPISSRRRATSMTSFQQQPFVGIKRQQGIQGRMPMQQQQFLQQKKSIKQPFLGGIGGGGLGSLGGGIDKSMLQKYRICIDCQSYGCDPKQVKTAIKCVNGQYHLTVCAPCKSDPALMLKRSFTLPGHVQRNKMIKQISPQGHCVIEFPLLEGPTFLNIPQLPPQKMKTPEGKKHLLLQVPIPVTMDPAKVKVCVKESQLYVKFEHRMTIGDICSRAFYFCRVPVPVGVDLSGITCKQNKHTLNIIAPLIKGTVAGYREIPIKRKERHRKIGKVGGLKLATDVATKLSTKKPLEQKIQPQKQQIEQKPSIISAKQPQPIQQKEKKPQPSISTSLQQQPQQKIQQQQPQTQTAQKTSSADILPTSQQITPTQKKPRQKKQQQLQTQQQQQQPLQQQQQPKSHVFNVQASSQQPSRGVSRGADLLDQVFGSKAQTKPTSTSTPTSTDKGVHEQSKVSGSKTSSSSYSNVVQGGGGGEQTKASDIGGGRQSSHLSKTDTDMPSSTTHDQSSSVSGAGIQ